MRFSTTASALVALTTLLGAQEKPYSEGNVDEFLANAKSEGRAAIVLFNFDHETG